MTTKAEIQKQIDALQAQLDEMKDETEDIYFWGLELGCSCNIPFNYIDGLFMVEKNVKHSPLPSHGLGRYRTKEYAEMARAFLIGALDLLKKDEDLQDAPALRDIDPSYNFYVNRGKEIIKQMMDGTYE